MVKRAVTPGRALEIRIAIVKPIPGCSYALQRGKSEIEQVQTGDDDLCFTLPVNFVATSDGSWDVRGPHVQGPRGRRFVYITSGTSAGQSGSCWTRRAKVPLHALASAAMNPAAVLATGFTARVAGRAADFGPACASVPLLGDGWQPQ